MNYARMVLLTALITTVGQTASAAPYLDSVTSDSPAIPRANNVKIMPLNVLFGELSVGYERRLGSHVSLVATPMFLLKQTVFEGFGIDKVPARFGVGGELGLRIWPTGHAMHGLYIEPFGGYAHLFEGDLDAPRPYVGGIDAALGGARLGYQWVLDNGAVLDLAGGAKYARIWQHANFAYNSGFSNLMTENSVSPTVRFGVGFAF